MSRLFYREAAAEPDKRDKTDRRLLEAENRH